MSVLSGKEHWDFVHQREEASTSSAIGEVSQGHGVPLPQPGTRVVSKAARGVKALLGERTLQRMTSYDEHLLWEVLFPRLLPDLTGARVLEVGSAPGEFLVKFGQRYGCLPYGVEYSEVGVELNRRVFRANGFDPDNVIHADFFSDAFLDRYGGTFDVVISRGFIEHFTDVASVVERHMQLIAPGGYLVLSIPNLLGINYPLVRFFHREVIAIHNLEIMPIDAFARLFERSDLERLYCDYYGTFSFCLFNTNGHSPRRHALNLAYKIQPFLNLAFRLMLRDKGFESRLSSPSLLFVGKKI